jgi:hypothetical protein
LTNAIIGEVFPTDSDVTPGTLLEWLSELERAGLIHRYQVDGESYIQCHDFRDHQVISKPQKSVLPPLDQADSGDFQSDSSSSTGTVPEPTLEHSKWEGNGREGKGTGNGRDRSEPVPGPDDAPLSHLLADLVADNDPDGKRPNVTRRWADEEDRMLRLDGRKPAEAERLIRWTQASSFWRGNVLSMPKFRERYTQLYNAAVEESQKRKGKARNGTSSIDPTRRRQLEEFSQRSRQSVYETKPEEAAA